MKKRYCSQVFSILCIMLILTGATGAFAQTATPPASGDGSAGDPYQIATLNNLYWIAENSARWDYAYIQTTNIDASATSGWFSGAGWSPIGNVSPYFTGTYDGQNYTISNLYINRPSTDDIGLFGDCFSGAIIENLGLTSTNITGNQYVGALIGYFFQTTVTNCYSSGSVNGTTQVGGLLGVDAQSTTSGCYSSATVTGSSQHVGGLMGTHNSNSITDCYATGSVTGTASTGGLVGHSYSTINTSFSTGTVNGSISGAGGLVGYLDSGGILNNCYSRSSTTGAARVGGLVGHLYGNSVNNCYSTGSVSGTSFVGGLVGVTNSGTVNNSFWDTQTSGQGSSDGGTGKTTALMKDHDDTFTPAGWDFELETANGTNDYWDIDYSQSTNNGYPFLSWQNGGDISLPVQAVSVYATCQGRSVILEWTTESETDNAGFTIERCIWDTQFEEIASYLTEPSLVGAGTTTNRTEYQFTDNSVDPGANYTYRINAVDIAGNSTEVAFIELTVDALPKTTELLPAYPNPFNPKTKISYTLAEDSEVSLKVMNLMGRTVKVLHSGKQPAGNYQVFWNGTLESGIRAPSGVYFIELQTGIVKQAQKVMLMQ